METPSARLVTSGSVCSYLRSRLDCFALETVRHLRSQLVSDSERSASCVGIICRPFSHFDDVDTARRYHSAAKVNTSPVRRQSRRTQFRRMRIESTAICSRKLLSCSKTDLPGIPATRRRAYRTARARSLRFRPAHTSPESEPSAFIVFVGTESDFG